MSSLGAVASAAASPRALMPSSPAKKGPLSEPVSWQYILDDLESSMDRLPDAVRRGIAGTARELGRSGDLGLAGARGGPTIIVPLVALSFRFFQPMTLRANSVVASNQIESC